MIANALLPLTPLKKGANPPKADGGFAVALGLGPCGSGFSRELFRSESMMEKLAAEAAPTKSKRKSKSPIAHFFKGGNSKSDGVAP